MYLDTNDYQTIWNLAHNWNNLDPSVSDESNLTDEVKNTIHRIMGAVNRKDLSLRSRRYIIFDDEDSIISFLFDLKHYREFYKCMKKDVFKESYLNSLYVRRSEVIRWCELDYLSPPPLWKSKEQPISDDKYDASDDENDRWYQALSDRRKQRVACLELAKKLWLTNPNQSYEEIFRHPTMKLYGNPNTFSLGAFKKWARPFSSEFAREGGRPKQNK